MSRKRGARAPILVAAALLLDRRHRVRNSGMLRAGHIVPQGIGYAPWTPFRSTAVILRSSSACAGPRATCAADRDDQGRVALPGARPADARGEEGDGQAKKVLIEDHLDYCLDTVVKTISKYL